jgi:hypothetical protein
MNQIDRYWALLDGSHQGIYTGSEVVGQALDLLNKGTDREALWQVLTSQHREEMARYLTSFDVTAPPLLPHDHWQRVKEDIIALKRWFEDR